jgi:hypothetical protein
MNKEILELFAFYLVDKVIANVYHEQTDLPASVTSICEYDKYYW